MPTLTREIIEAAIAGFESQQQRIEKQIAELKTMLNGDRQTSRAAPATGSAKRKFSPETLQRMREGQQKRWAKVHGKTAEAKARKPKRRLSAKGRKAIVEALKKRWAVKKAQAA